MPGKESMTEIEVGDDENEGGFGRVGWRQKVESMMRMTSVEVFVWHGNVVMNDAWWSHLILFRFDNSQHFLFFASSSSSLIVHLCQPRRLQFTLTIWQ